MDTLKNEEIFEFAPGSENGRIDEDNSLKLVRDNLACRLNEKDADHGSITSANLNPSAAFEVFAGKSFFNRSNYSLADTIEKRTESPLQRFARLRGELDDLQNDLDAIVKEEVNQESSVWSTLQTEARKMVSNLIEIKDHDGFKLHQKKTDSITQRFEQVSSKILQASSVPPLPSASTSSSSSSVGPAPSSDTDVMALERRVSALETMLGFTSNVLDAEGSISAVSSVKGCTFPLVDTVLRLERRVSLMDPTTLETLRSKAALLKTELEALHKVKGSAQELQTLEAARRVDDLYQQVERVRLIAEEAPTLIVRLKTLEHIHSAAALFTQRLDMMEQTVVALTGEIKSNDDVLSSLKSGLAENSKTILENLNKMSSGASGGKKK